MKKIKIIVGVLLLSIGLVFGGSLAKIPTYAAIEDWEFESDGYAYFVGSFQMDYYITIRTEGGKDLFYKKPDGQWTKVPDFNEHYATTSKDYSKTHIKITSAGSQGVTYSLAQSKPVGHEVNYEQYDSYSGQNKVEFRFAHDYDLSNPIINGQTYYITDVDNPILKNEIKKGLYAFDNIDGYIPYNQFVEISDNYTANMYKVGIWTIKYSVTDSNGNSSYVDVRVKVSDVSKPVISGPKTYSVSTGTLLLESDIRANLIVTDNYDKGLTPLLVSDNYTPNYTIPGIYQIKYKAVDDSSNVSDEFSVTVTVGADEIPPDIYTTDYFINVSGGLNLSQDDIIAHLIMTGQLSADIMNHYSVFSSDYNPSESGVYLITLARNDDADQTLKERITIGIRVLEEDEDENPIIDDKDDDYLDDSFGDKFVAFFNDYSVYILIGAVLFISALLIARFAGFGRRRRW